MSRFQHLTLDPSDPRTLYLGARWEGGYHRSDDGGDTWQHASLGPIFRRADRILPDPTQANILYAETHHQGLFKSYNRGRSWVSSSEGIAPQKRTPHYGAVLISGLAIDPDNRDTLYAGSDYSNWKSTDAGETWNEVGLSLTCEFARSFLVTSRAVYAGTNVGIYRSYDAGDTWESCNRGLPTREIIAATQGSVDGESFEFAITRGRPAVFRRSLDRSSDWVSISWLLYETADAIRFEDSTETLVIHTPGGERRSEDGGLRWDITPTVYAPKQLTRPAPPPVEPSSQPVDTWQIPIAIHGAPQPDDSSIEPMYQRPHYVALAIVSPGYPADGSAPLWATSWEDSLSGVLTVPKTVFAKNAVRFLRVEVRDFQYGTRVGASPLTAAGGGVISVSLNPIRSGGRVSDSTGEVPSAASSTPDQNAGGHTSPPARSAER
jgi:hypothetical protein